MVRRDTHTHTLSLSCMQALLCSTLAGSLHFCLVCLFVCGDQLQSRYTTSKTTRSRTVCATPRRSSAWRSRCVVRQRSRYTIDALALTIVRMIQPDRTNLVVGMSDGTLSVRKRAPKHGPPGRSKKQVVLHGGTKRHRERGRNAHPSAVCLQCFSASHLISSHLIVRMACCIVRVTTSSSCVCVNQSSSSTRSCSSSSAIVTVWMLS